MTSSVAVSPEGYENTEEYKRLKAARDANPGMARSQSNETFNVNPGLTDKSKAEAEKNVKGL